MFKKATKEQPEIPVQKDKAKREKGKEREGKARQGKRQGEISRL